MRKFPCTSDLTGQKYNHLTAVELVSRKPPRWRCLCDCGTYTTVLSSNLKSGKVKSCGCIHHRGNPTHGLSGTRLYRIYKKIIRRCYCESEPAFPNYGGRGIKVCEEWRDSVESFYEWAMKNGYSESLTIDRIDNDGDYSPQNCRWANAKEQSNNRRSNREFTIGGEQKDLTQWCEEYGVSYTTVHARITRGWDIIDALTYKGDARKRKQKEKKNARSI